MCRIACNASCFRSKMTQGPRLGCSIRFLLCLPELHGCGCGCTHVLPASLRLRQLSQSVLLPWSTHGARCATDLDTSRWDVCRGGREAQGRDCTAPQASGWAQALDQVSPTMRGRPATTSVTPSGTAGCAAGELPTERGERAAGRAGRLSSQSVLQHSCLPQTPQ